MKARTLVIGACALLLIGGAVAAWLHFFELREVREKGPPVGEARYNELYVLKRLLQTRGLAVDSRARLALDQHPLDPNDALVMMGDLRSLSEADVERLLDFVAQGGRLTLRLPHVEENSYLPLVNDIGLYVQESGYRCLRVKNAPQTLEPVCSDHRFLPWETEDGEPPIFRLLWTWGNTKDGYLIGRVGYGDGEILMASSLYFLGNEGLQEPGMLRFSERLLPHLLGSGTTHLIYAGDMPPWYVLLWQNFHQALLPAALALLAWLAWRMQRLGNLLAEAPPRRRALLEHIDASGEFAFVRHRALALYAAYQRALFDRLRRRDPLLAALEGEALLQALSERSGIAADTLRAALHPQDLGRKERFTDVIRTLSHLRQRL